MSWVTALWSAAIAVCVTLALQNLLVWMRDRTARAHLLLSVAMIGTAAVGVCELLLMRAGTTERYGLVLRWIHVPLTIVVLCLVGFVRLYLHAGRTWLAWMAIGTRVFASLALNFLLPLGLVYTAFRRLGSVSLFGETVSVAEGVRNPWGLFGPLSTAFTIAFFVDAAVTTWRRGARRQALLLCGSMILYGVVGLIHVTLIHEGIVRSPYFLTFGFLGITAAMSYEMAGEVFRARTLAGRLQTREAEAHESEERLSLVVKAASIGIWVWDIARDDLWFSDTARVLWGFGESERITFDRLLGSVHPDDREIVSESMRMSLAEGGEFEREFRVLAPGGEVRWVSSRGAVERDGERVAVRMRGVSLDVTSRKVAEAELLRHRGELAHLSRVGTVGELSGSLAHELSQPLTAILSNAQAAQRHLAGPAPDLNEVQEILKDIVAEDMRAGEVIHRVRLLLRKGQVNRQLLDLSGVVEDVLKIMRSELVSQEVSVTRDLATDLPMVAGDPIQFQQVLMNLVVNGCEAMAGGVIPGERRLTVRTRRNEPGAIEVSVGDSGSGIPIERLTDVFEPFFTTKPRGMGLGLAVCRTIIEAHGGRIWAENNPAASGATIHFCISAARGPA
jgi:two-component system sensor kinase FixL